MIILKRRIHEKIIIGDDTIIEVIKIINTTPQKEVILKIETSKPIKTESWFFLDGKIKK